MESTLFWAMHHLDQCYKTLASKDKVVLRESSTRFALLYSSLASAEPGVFRIKPKLHAWLEACAEGGDPASHWCYRDEDFGGSVSNTGRRRGSQCTVAGVSLGVLSKFCMNPPIRVTA